MKIAILSDSHDQINHLRAAVTESNKAGARILIHCGDLISPFMLKELAAFSGAVHLIYGNNVGDQHLISSSCSVKYPTITHHGVFGAVEAGGLKIAFTHYPQMARGLAGQGSFDVVCCGHNHTFGVEEVGDSLLVNPGELLGGEGRPTFILFETETREVTRMEVGAQIV